MNNTNTAKKVLSLFLSVMMLFTMLLPMTGIIAVAADEPGTITVYASDGTTDGRPGCYVIPEAAEPIGTYATLQKALADTKNIILTAADKYYVFVVAGNVDVGSAVSSKTIKTHIHFTSVDNSGENVVNISAGGSGATSFTVSGSTATAGVLAFSGNVKFQATGKPGRFANVQENGSVYAYDSVSFDAFKTSSCGAVFQVSRYDNTKGMMTNLVLTDNVAITNCSTGEDASEGGAIAVAGTGYTKVEISGNVVIAGTKSGCYGGAILAKGTRKNTNPDITITGNVTIENNTSTHGSGIFTDNTSAVYVEGATFKNNSATNWGGAVYISVNSAQVFRNCTFIGNTAGKCGGAISDQEVGDGAASSSTRRILVLDNCVLKDNKVTGTSGKGGSAIMSYGALLAFINDTTITENTSARTDKGGCALIIQNGCNYDAHFLLSGSTTITGNTNGSGNEANAYLSATDVLGILKAGTYSVHSYATKPFDEAAGTGYYDFASVTADEFSGTVGVTKESFTANGSLQLIAREWGFSKSVIDAIGKTSADSAEILNNGTAAYSGKKSALYIDYEGTAENALGTDEIRYPDADAVSGFYNDNSAVESHAHGLKLSTVKANVVDTKVSSYYRTYQDYKGKNITPDDTINVYLCQCQPVIHYDKNAEDATGNTPDTVAEKGGKVIVRENGFEREGYIFLGWADTAEAEEPVYNPGDHFELYTINKMPSKTSFDNIETTLYAIWAPMEAKVYYAYTGNIPEEAPDVPEAKEYSAGEQVTVEEAPEVAGYTFSGWSTTTADVTVTDGKFTMPTKGVQFTGYFTANDDTPYTVEFYYQNVDGTYTIDDGKTDTTRTGTTGSTAFATADDKVAPTGFIYDTDNNIGKVTIAGDGSAVLKIYFDRQVNTVTYKAYNDDFPNGLFLYPETEDTEDAEESEDPAEDEPEVLGEAEHVTSYKYGETIVPEEEIPSCGVEGYHFAGWQITGELPETMDGVDYVLEASYDPDSDVPYIINYYAQNIDDDEYTLMTEKCVNASDGVFGETLTADTTAPTGFVLNSDKTNASGVISLDETLVLNVYFDRQTYDVTFVTPNGSETKEYRYGDMPECTISTDKAADKTNTYTFNGWDNEIVPVDGETTYTAQYIATKIIYTVKFVKDDGSPIKTLSVNFGDPISQPENVTKTATAQYTYTFENWDKTVPATVDDTIVFDEDNTVVYKAVFSSEVNYYDVKWTNKGEEIYTDSIAYGETPEYDEETYGTPTYTDDTYTYTFKGWSPEISPVTGDIEYKAQYDTEYINYTITFYNPDGTVLSEKTDYHWGQEVIVPDAPSKAADAQYSYEFKAWTPEVVENVAGNAEYRPTYDNKLNKYDVIWKNWDGTVLEKDEDVAYGTDPTYDGATPVKESTAQFEYIFNGWDPKESAVTGDVVYTAKYTPQVREYTITWSNWDGTPLDTDDVLYGDIPAYTGDEPTKPADDKYSYEFSGWDKEIVEVTGEETYTAVFTATVNKYDLTINYLYEDGSVAHAPYTAKVEYDAEYSVDSPVIAHYDADKTNVSGVMGTGAEINVYYSLTSYDLTIQPVDEDGNPICDPIVVPVLYGETYDEKAPYIPGYLPAEGEEDITVVMDTEGKDITVHYVINPDEWTEITYKIIEGTGEIIGSDVVPVIIGSEYSTDLRPEVKVKDGYMVTKWTNEPGTITGPATVGIVVKKDYSKWVTITYKYEGLLGDKKKEKEVLKGSKYSESFRPDNVTAPKGMAFDYWENEPANGDIINTDIEVVAVYKTEPQPSPCEKMIRFFQKIIYFFTKMFNSFGSASNSDSASSGSDSTFGTSGSDSTFGTSGSDSTFGSSGSDSTFGSSGSGDTFGA